MSKSEKELVERLEAVEKNMILANIERQIGLKDYSSLLVDSINHLDKILELMPQDQMKASTMALFLIYLEGSAARVSLALKSLNVIFDNFRCLTVPRFMEEQGDITSIMTPYGRLQIQDDIRVSKGGASDEALWEWLEEIGSGDLIKETVNASSLKSVIRKRIEEGLEVPEFLNVKPYTRSNVVKG